MYGTVPPFHLENLVNFLYLILNVTPPPSYGKIY